MGQRGHGVLLRPRVGLDVDGWIMRGERGCNGEVRPDGTAHQRFDSVSVRPWTALRFARACLDVAAPMSGIFGRPMGRQNPGPAFRRPSHAVSQHAGSGRQSEH